MVRAIAAFALLLAALFVYVPSALADGIMIPPPDIPIRDAFAIRYHRVTVEVRDGFVRTEIDQEFENLTGRRIQADYVFPIPHGAVLENFVMWVGGEKLAGKVLPADEARSIYEEIVRKQLDPALLEYIGNDAFRARVFPIEPGERKRIQLSYTQMLTADNGVYAYVYPLNTEKFSARMIDQVTVSGKIETGVPIKTVYSPSHAISVNRKDDTHASFSYEASNVRPDIDFVLYYSVDAKEIGASLLAYDADDAEDGFFVATITPRVESEDAKVINKNFIFVLDKSGSMADNDKLGQAKSALRFVLQSLNRGDRFNVIAYSDELWECFEDGMKTYAPATLEEALKFVQQFDAVGGTNINDALLRALDMLKQEGGAKPSYIVFLTDGLPTVGITGEGDIISGVTDTNRTGARLFAFGVGYDVNTHLLDKLSEGNHGITEYVRPNEDIEVKVSSLYAKISSPVLTDVSLNFQGAKVSEVFPKEMPDLFKGNQLIIAGRFAPGERSAAIELTGKVDGKSRSFSFPVSFGSRASYSFVPRVWAGRKIGYLTDEIRLHGTNEELVAEIVRLSKRYGIITEYTSFLIREDGLFAEEDEAARFVLDVGRAAMEAKSGAGGVGQAQTSQRLKGQTAGGQGTAAAPQSYYDIAGKEVQAKGVKYLGDLTFFFVEDYWTDSRYDPDRQEVVEVQAFSPAYFELLSANKELGKFAALGGQVILVLDDKSALKISAEEGAQELTEEQVSQVGQQVARQSGATGTW